MTRPAAARAGRSAQSRIAIEAARARLSAVVDGVQEHPVLLTRRGRAVAAVITLEQYALLVAAEEKAAARLGRAGDGEPDEGAGAPPPADETHPCQEGSGDLH